MGQCIDSVPSHAEYDHFRLSKVSELVWKPSLCFFFVACPLASCKALSWLIEVHFLPEVGAGQVKEGAISRYSWIRSGVLRTMNE